VGVGQQANLPEELNYQQTEAGQGTKAENKVGGNKPTSQSGGVGDHWASLVGLREVLITESHLAGGGANQTELQQ
jgi:hypothetical protein